MSDTQKKLIPKFKKKLSGFLSDEGGKITKEDILKVGMLAMGIATFIPGASGAAGHANASHSNFTGTHPEHANYATNCSAVANHANANVNGHVNAYNPGLASLTQSLSGHSNHGNHISHSSHLSHVSY